MLTLTVQERDTNTKPADLRASGVLPGIFYGRVEEATPVAIDQATFEKVWREAGETTIISLSGAGDDKQVLIHSVDRHPVTGTPLHVDFYVFEKGKKLHVSVPIEFEGIPPAEKEGGVIVKTLHELEMDVSPAELPQHVTVDISKLENIGDHITAGEIEVPPSAELSIAPDEVVVSVTEEQEEPEEPQAPTPEEAAAVPSENGAPDEEASGEEDKEKDKEEA